MKVSVGVIDKFDRIIVGRQNYLVTVAMIPSLIYLFLMSSSRTRSIK